MTTKKTTRKLWVHGEEIPMEYIEVGDFITFRTPDQPDKAGVVARLMDLGEQDHLRKIAYLDRFGYVLNGYPDKVTTAHWTATREQQEKHEKVVKKKKTKQYKRFERSELGRTYGYGFSKHHSTIYTKFAPNKWVVVETSPYGGFEFGYVDDETVFYNVLDDETGNLATPLRPT